MKNVESFIKSVSENIKRKREQRGMTQHELAVIVNISQSSISRLENGAEMVSVETLWRICHALQVPITEILTEDIEYKINDNSVKGLIEHLNMLPENKRTLMIKYFEGIIELK